MWGPGKSRNPEFLPSVRPGTQLWGIEERWGVMDDGSDPSAQCRKWGSSPPPPTASLSPSPPGIQMCTATWLVLAPSLPAPPSTVFCTETKTICPAPCSRQCACMSQAQRSSLVLLLLPSLHVSDFLLPQGIPSLYCTAEEPVTGGNVAFFLSTAPRRHLVGSLDLSPS